MYTLDMPDYVTDIFYYGSIEDYTIANNSTVAVDMDTTPAEQISSETIDPTNQKENQEKAKDELYVLINKRIKS
jgi:hypothetical protein